MNVTVWLWLASSLDSFDTRCPAAIIVNSATVSLTECGCEELPWMSSTTSVVDASSAAVMGSISLAIRRALARHKSQIARIPDWKEKIRHMASVMAAKEPFKYGESFKRLALSGP